MANSYTQIHIQFVFAVKYRRALIHKEWKERLHEYITGIFQMNKHKMLQINSMPDHVHIFIGMRPHQSISSLIQNVKTESSKCPPDRTGKGSRRKIFLLILLRGKRAMELFLMQKARWPMLFAIFKIRRHITGKKHF